MALVFISGGVQFSVLVCKGQENAYIPNVFFLVFGQIACMIPVETAW